MLNATNLVILHGNLGRDPEFRKLENGKLVGKASIATNEFYRDKNGEQQQNTEWHDLVFWGKTAELAERLLKKGASVLISGKLTHRSYETQDGNKRYVTEVVVSSFNLTGGHREGGNGNFPTAGDEPQPFRDMGDEGDDGEEMEAVGSESADEDLPF